MPLQGSLWALSAAALPYVVATTGQVCWMSIFTAPRLRRWRLPQSSPCPTVEFSGLKPGLGLEGVGRMVGELWPATYSRGQPRGCSTKGAGP